MLMITQILCHVPSQGKDSYKMKTCPTQKHGHFSRLPKTQHKQGRYNLAAQGKRQAPSAAVVSHCSQITR